MCIDQVQLRHLVNHTGLGMHYVYGFPPDRVRGMPPMQDLMEGKHNYESIFVSKKPNTKFAYSVDSRLILPAGPRSDCSPGLLAG